MKITVSVTNDLVTDQRVHKVCTTLTLNGYEVKLVGRKFRNSQPLERIYKTDRLRLFFNRSALFYAEYNIRLFFYLLFDKTNLYLSNDTDSLLANYLASKIRRKPLVFDAHEMFPEVPEVAGRKWIKAVWTKIENILFPKLKNTYTVCQSIADIYNNKYGIDMQVVRNIPLFVNTKTQRQEENKTITLSLRGEISSRTQKIILYQGAVNVGRGIEWVIDAMPYLDDFIFYVVGDGDILPELKERVNRLKLNEKVIFTGRVPFEELPAYTAQADIGVNLLENRGLNYYYSLPNRIFDYMRMHVPVLAVDFPEIRRIVAHYGTGTLVNHCEPQFLAETIKQMLAQGKNEAGFAAANAELSWENESETLLKVIRKALKKPEKEMEKSVKLSYRRSMDEKRIHIIAFNIPYPANYGGVIDVFYKLKALSGNGVKITLHVFEYGRKPSLELEKHCEKVYYYKRKTGIFSQLSGLPYIVYSRRSKELLANLLKDNSPILFEGLHCCYCLNHPLLKNRLKMVRAHNIESVYYRGLAQNTTSLLLKLYFSWEARKLEKFEPVLSQANYILTLSTTEKIYFETKFGKDKTVYIPLFFQNQLVDSNMQPEIKPFVLYHGDLSTPENRKAVAFLIHSVASKDKNIPWIFAGLNPRKNLLKLAESHKNVTVIANLSEEKMSQLIQEASVNILFTHQVSGVKVKLLHALANGRHCLANKETVKSSGLEKLCRIISNRPDEILETIRECLQKPIPETEITRRKTVFYQIYDNNLNALKINKLLKISPI